MCNLDLDDVSLWFAGLMNGKTLRKKLWPAAEECMCVSCIYISSALELVLSVVSIFIQFKKSVKEASFSICWVDSLLL